MITIRKLQTLPTGTRVRKTIRLLDSFVQYRWLPGKAYMQALLELLADDLEDSVPGLHDLRQSVSADVLPPGGSSIRAGREDPATMVPERDRLLRQVDNLRHELRIRTSAPAADWDLLPPAGYGTATQSTVATIRAGDSAGGSAGPSASASAISLYLESVRSPFNIGSIIRTAVALGAGRVGLSPDCPAVDHPRVGRSAMGAERSIEIVRLPLSDLENVWQPLIALEPGGTVVRDFEFPGRGTLLLGSEELGLSAEARAAATACVSVPLSGAKGSLNVGVACGIALYEWVSALRTLSG